MDPKYDQQPLDSQQEPQEEKTVEKSSDDLFYWLNALTTALVVLVLVFTFFGRLTRVDGHSMDNTLQDNQLLLVWSLGYTPQQGDIVVVNKTTVQQLGGSAIVKRVIAVGGQTVDIDYAASSVYVDGELLDEPYIKEPMFDRLGAQGSTHIEVPEGSIFVMGDNRNHSKDSRSTEIGQVDKREILGRVALLLLPGTDGGGEARDYSRIGMVD